MVTSCVGVTAAQMKVLRTFGGDKTSFTRLLRCLSPLGDAPGCTTYDDSGARLVFERRGDAERAPGEAWFGFRRGHNVAGGRVGPQPK